MGKVYFSFKLTSFAKAVDFKAAKFNDTIFFCWQNQQQQQQLHQATALLGRFCFICIMKNLRNDTQKLFTAFNIEYMIHNVLILLCFVVAILTLIHYFIHIYIVFSDSFWKLGERERDKMKWKIFISTFENFEHGKKENTVNVHVFVHIYLFVRSLTYLYLCSSNICVPYVCAWITKSISKVHQKNRGGSSSSRKKERKQWRKQDVNVQYKRRANIHVKSLLHPSFGSKHVRVK